MCADHETNDDALKVRKCRALLDALIEICATEALALEMWRRIIGLHFDGVNPPVLHDRDVRTLAGWLNGATKAAVELTHSGFFDKKS